jgi:CRP/FNR family cyclic AMP-dependent transcriptional regulator
MTDNSIDFSFVGPQVPSRTFKAGQVIFSEREIGAELFVIQSGKVQLKLGNRLLESLDANGIFGEMALIDSHPRSATAVAVTDVMVVPVTEKQFLFLVGHTPFFALKVMRVMAARLRAANDANRKS